MTGKIKTSEFSSKFGLDSVQAVALLKIMNSLSSGDAAHNCVVIADASFHESDSSAATMAIAVFPHEVKFCVRAYQGITQMPVLETMAVQSGIDLAHKTLGESAKIQAFTDCDTTIQKHTSSRVFGTTVNCNRPNQVLIAPSEEIARLHNMADLITKRTRKHYRNWQPNGSPCIYEQKLAWSEGNLIQMQDGRGRN